MDDEDMGGGSMGDDEPSNTVILGGKAPSLRRFLSL